MLKKINPTDLIGAVIKKIKETTSKKCYDDVPENAKSPFFFVEFVQSIPQNSKTMFRERYTVWIHCISGKIKSSAQVYEMIQEVQESLTSEITLPEPYLLHMVVDNGVQTVKKDETGERHAVLSYDFVVCYGFKCK